MRQISPENSSEPERLNKNPFKFSSQSSALESFLGLRSSSIMEKYKFLLLVAILLGCVALLFTALALPHLCSVKLLGKVYYCQGFMYQMMGKIFLHSTLENIIKRVMFIFHLFAFLCGAATVIMIIVALCKKLTTNITYMVATLVLATLTTLELLVAAIMMTFLLQTFKESELYPKLETKETWAMMYYGRRTHVAMFWTAFAISTATLICIVLAFAYLTEDYKTKGRKTETMRGKSAGKTRGRGRGKSAVQTKDRSRGKSAAETKNRMGRK